MLETATNYKEVQLYENHLFHIFSTLAHIEFFLGKSPKIKNPRPKPNPYYYLKKNQKH